MNRRPLAAPPRRIQCLPRGARSRAFGLAALLALLPSASPCLDLPKEMGKETAECVRCHREHTPGVVHDWAKSRHAWTRPEAAYEKSALTRRISAEKPPEAFRGRVVGCFECHGQNPDQHADSFDHLGFRIHVVVTPRDCEVCHPVEVSELSRSKKAFAYENLRRNPLYSLLAQSLAGEGEDAGTRGEACSGCHGAEVTVRGRVRVRTAMGEIEVPDLANWPNQGAGRVNPDGSRGTCGACHSRHAFAVEDARHPEACERCHAGGHSPAREAYEGSAHAALYRAGEPEFDWGNAPWIVGQDFGVPTCAACHVSQVVNDRGGVLARRTHDLGSRLWVRLLGLPFSHPQPVGGETQGLRNAEGQPLPTSLDGGPAAQGLLSADEQGARRAAMAALCAGCHSRALVQGHFQRLDAAVRDADAGVRKATALVREGWSKGLAAAANPFDERLERLWVEAWLLDATALRYAAAMGGGPGLGLPTAAGTGVEAVLRQMTDQVRPVAPK